MGLQLAQEEFQDIPTDPVLLTIVIPCPSERRWYCRSHQSLCHRSHAWHPEGLGPHTGAAWMTREGIALRLAIHSPELCKHMTSLNIVGRIFQPSCSRCPFFLTKVLSSLLMIGCLASCTSSHPFSLSLSPCPIPPLLSQRVQPMTEGQPWAIDGAFYILRMSFSGFCGYSKK